MFTLNINELEKRRLLSYACHSMRDQLHWGDGEIIIPEEQILEKKIKDAENLLILDFEQLELLINWFLEATGEGLLLLGEDISVLHKIIGQLSPYHDELKRKYDTELRMIKAKIDTAENVLARLSRILPKTGEKVEVEEPQDESVLVENIDTDAPDLREVEEFRQEPISDRVDDDVDKLREEAGEQRVEIIEDQEKEKLESKMKRAKKLKEEMHQAEELAKRAKKKSKGKKLF